MKNISIFQDIVGIPVGCNQVPFIDTTFQLQVGDRWIQKIREKHLFIIGRVDGLTI